MRNTVIFDPYPPFFYDTITLMDVSAGILTISIILSIFGFKDDNGDFNSTDTGGDFGDAVEYEDFDDDYYN
ncbi:MAG: hypothetical protein K2K16_00525 [Ruminococcus sp.]|nr:hypothetical protein [Ruminococcus sp.]